MRQRTTQQRTQRHAAEEGGEHREGRRRCAAEGQRKLLGKEHLVDQRGRAGDEEHRAEAALQLLLRTCRR